VVKDQTRDMGPLPEGDRQDTLQQRSLKAFRNCLPEDQFLFRDERTDDKGVDGSLEVKLQFPAAGGPNAGTKECFTNCRAQVQLKSLDHPAYNGDGSVSLSVATSNLNYLLNGPCPLYVVWIAETGEVRYAWAREEWKRLDAENPGWQNQATFTVRFVYPLTKDALAEIHSRVLNEARFARHVHEMLAQAALHEQVVVTIEPRTLKTTDPLQIYAWITSSGMTIVGAGYGLQVLNGIELLNPQHRREARVRLVSGYANATLGRYHLAAGDLAEVAVRRAELSAPDQRFLDYLRGVCEYQTGRIDIAEYLRREDEWATRHDGIGAAEHRLESLRLQRLGEGDLDRRAEMLAQMQLHAAAIEASPDATAGQKLQARIVLLSARGDDLAVHLLEDIVTVEARGKMGLPNRNMALAVMQAIRQRMQAWWQDANAVVQDAEKLRHPLLTADALVARVRAMAGILEILRLNAELDGKASIPDQSLTSGLMVEAERAMATYRLAGHTEGECRAKIVLAELFLLGGQVEAARNLAAGVLAVAEAMSWQQVEAQARPIVTGETLMRKVSSGLAEQRAIDEDEHLAVRTDEDMRQFAKFNHTALGLPMDRLPVVERGCRTMRQFAHERLNWCRHIEYLENLSHRGDPATLYATDPPLACRCEKHGYESLIEDPDPHTVLAAFKRACCEGCADRSPKRGESAYR
jgi:hypothetical protein